MKIIIPDGLTQKEVFRYLHTNKQEAIDLKKSVSKETDILPLKPFSKSIAEGAVKASPYLYENDEEKGIVKRTIVGNTYNWLDSHDDVHLNNLFSKSIQDRGTRVPHLHDHIFQLGAKVGIITSIKEVDIAWSELKVNASGNTMALVAESEVKKRLNENVYEAYLNDEIDQHSVAMIYIKMALALNDKDYEEEYKVWKSIIDLLGNPEKANKQGYFWGIYEAKLIELSAVLMGSNELTPTLGSKAQPLKGTAQREPAETTPIDVDKIMESYINGLTK